MKKGVRFLNGNRKLKKNLPRSASGMNVIIVEAQVSIEKQTKNRNETGSNLSLGTGLTRVKHLSRKC